MPPYAILVMCWASSSLIKMYVNVLSSGPCMSSWGCPWCCCLGLSAVPTSGEGVGVAWGPCCELCVRAWQAATGELHLWTTSPRCLSLQWVRLTAAVMVTKGP